MDATQANNKDSPVASPEILSPGGKSRYGRTRKPKISRDYYNTEDVVFEADVVKKQSPKSTKRQPSIKSPVVGQEIHFEIKDEVTKIDDLGTKIANNFKANLQRGIDDSIKERKFFKSTPEIMTKAELPNEVDVTKVFKLISNNPIISLDSNEKKMTPKSTLKTYSNKRKHFQGSDSFVVESFGLPDEPIIPLHTPVRVQKRHDKIDVDLEINPALHLLPETWTFDSQTIPICDIDDEIIEIRDSSFTRNSNKVDQNLNITFSTDLKENSAGEESIDKTTIEANNKSHLLESNLCEEQPQLMESNIKENKRNEEQKNKKRSSNYSLAQVKRVLRSNTESNVNAPAPEKRDLIPVNILKNIKKEISCNTIENEKEKKSNQKIVKQKLKNAHLKNSKILFNPLAKQGEKSNKTDVDSVIKEKRVLRSSTSNVDVTPIKNIPKSSTSDTETSISTKQEKHTSEMKQIKKKRHPWNKKKNEITESDLIQIKLESIELEIGDLAWAKIGNHPYWPCLITAEPQSGIHKKLGNRNLILA